MAIEAIDWTLKLRRPRTAVVRCFCALQRGFPQPRCLIEKIKVRVQAAARYLVSTLCNIYISTYLASQQPAADL